jgi:hypothetical protein
MSEFDSLSVRINRDVLSLEEIDKRAKELGLNRSQFVTFALETLVKFDLDRLKSIKANGEMICGLPFWATLENIIIKNQAKRQAHFDAWEWESTIGPGVIDEFTIIETPKGPKALTGNELYEALRAKYIKEEEQKRLDYIIGLGLSAPLSDAQIEFLKKFPTGRAWLESRNQK